MLDLLGNFDRCMHRFHFHLEDGAASGSEGFKDALVEFYVELIRHCEDAADFLAISPFSNAPPDCFTQTVERYQR